MKTKYSHLTSVLTLLALTSLEGQLSTAFAENTAFTYQGQLNDSGAPANGTYDISFAAYDAATLGNLVSVIVTNPAVAVSNGVFSTAVDLGAGPFTGVDLWLEIGVSTNAANAFTTISPRQLFTRVPYAIYSKTSGTATTLASNSVSAAQLNTAAGPGSGQVLSFNGTQLVWQDPAIGGSTGGWSLTGNLGTSPGINFLGTVDNQPIELKAGNVRALRLEPDVTSSGAPNFIGGSPANYVSNTVVGATIAGGGGLDLSNSITASYAAVVGGVKNIAGGQQSFVGGGFQNLASGYISTVAGGAYNSANSTETFIGGGAYNIASGLYSTVAGGYNSIASADYGSVLGGGGNLASGVYSTVAGGNANVASGSDPLSYFVLGGPSVLSLVGTAVVGGGYANQATGTAAMIPGGIFNTASGDLSFAAGGGAQALHPGSFVWADNSSFYSYFSSSAANQFLIRASGGVAIGTNQPPPGGLIVASGGFAVTGASSPHYPGAQGVFIEKAAGNGLIYGFNYPGSTPLPLCLNTPGGNVGIGTTTPAYTLDVNGTTRTHSIIITGGADLAEPFNVGSQTVEKGSVVVIDETHPGELKLSTTAYDTHVAGIVSGAKGINPGIALHQEGALEGGQNVALSGRVYVLADATHAAIAPGDLLTTSDTPGHAMKVRDHDKAQGAILGKAMGALTEGQGLVLVLVTLQ